VSEEYREAFGEHAYDSEGNYVGPFEFAETEFTPETEAQAAWADYVAEHGTGEGAPEPGADGEIAAAAAAAAPVPSVETVETASAPAAAPVEGDAQPGPAVPDADPAAPVAEPATEVSGPA
jgi:hypothetical protein